MDEENRDLANRLFATATAMLEDAVELAAAGQSPRLSPPQLVDHGARLQTAAQDIAIIGEAAMIVANLSDNQRRNRQKPAR
jgi:hypothetical protein